MRGGVDLDRVATALRTAVVLVTASKVVAASTLPMVL